MAQSGISAENYFAAAQQLPGAFLREKFTENGLTEDQAQAIQTSARNVRVEELLGQNSGAIDGRIERGSALANRRRNQKANQAKAKTRASDTVLAAILADIDRIERRLADQYGSGFAGDLLADLSAKGLVSDDEYARIMAIEDDTERRRAIALRIQEGLDNGTIKPEDLKEHPWAHEWLDKHKQATTEMTLQAARYERGEIDADDLDRNAKFEAGKSDFLDGNDQQGAAELATDYKEQSEHEVLRDEEQFAANINLSISKPV